jgi:ligand-binding sensor domain-containing protein
MNSATNLRYLREALRYLRETKMSGPTCRSSKKALSIFARPGNRTIFEASPPGGATKPNKQPMPLNLIFLLGTLTVLASCDRQNTSREAGKAPGDPLPFIAGVDTVKELGNNIMTIYQDKRNNYWFGSWQDGLYRYDGKTILHFTTKSGLPHNRVDDIQEDQQGNIYFNTSGGLCQFDGQKINVLQAGESNAWALQAGDLWFKSPQYDNKVCRYDGKELYSLELPKTALGEDWMAKYPTTPNPYAAYTIYKDSKGNVWFGTAVLGACRYNGESFDWISEEDVTELHNGPSNGVRSIIEDRDGCFWFNSAYRYRVYGQGDAPRRTFYSREKSIGNLDGRPDSDFWEYISAARDNNNDLWIATYENGVWRYDGKRTTHYPIQIAGADTHLFYIYKDNNGGLWLGTHENGAFRFNGQFFERFKA